jgi:hypothetical protein
MAGEWLKRGRRWYFSAGLAALAPCACAPMPPQQVQPPQAYYPPPWYYVPRPAPPQINAPDGYDMPRRHQQQTPSVIEQPGPVAETPAPRRSPPPASGGPECVGWWRICHFFF